MSWTALEISVLAAPGVIHGVCRRAAQGSIASATSLAQLESLIRATEVELSSADAAALDAASAL